MALLDADHVELWESQKADGIPAQNCDPPPDRSAKLRRRSTRRWASSITDRCLFEKTDLAITADGSDDNLINVEDMEREFSFMDADSTPEPLEDVLPTSPAPADEEHLPG